MTAATKRAKAKPRSNGEANGAAAGSPPTVRPPEEVVLPGPVSPAPAGHHPYGDRPIFVWNPRDGSDPIVLPEFSTVEVSQEFLISIYQKPGVFQNVELMILAGVPLEIQKQVGRLGDKNLAEQEQMFSAWYRGVTQPMGPELPGES